MSGSKPPTERSDQQLANIGALIGIMVGVAFFCGGMFLILSAPKGVNDWFGIGTVMQLMGWPVALLGAGVAIACGRAAAKGNRNEKDV